MYIAKAFICILDIELLNKIRLQLIELGYKSFYSGGQTQLAINKGLYALNAPDIDGFIDCNHYANGDEEKAIELFLELAKMEDSKIAAKNQWIFDKYEDGSYGNLHKSTAKYPCLPFKYATPLELAEAVKDGRAKL